MEEGKRKTLFDDAEWENIDGVRQWLVESRGYDPHDYEGMNEAAKRERNRAKNEVEDFFNETFEERPVLVFGIGFDEHWGVYPDIAAAIGSIQVDHEDMLSIWDTDGRLCFETTHGKLAGKPDRYGPEYMPVSYLINDGTLYGPGWRIRDYRPPSTVIPDLIYDTEQDAQAHIDGLGVSDQYEVRVMTKAGEAYYKGWCDGAGDHPTGRANEEEALEMLKDPSRTELPRFAEKWFEDGKQRGGKGVSKAMRLLYELHTYNGYASVSFGDFLAHGLQSKDYAELREEVRENEVWDGRVSIVDGWDEERGLVQEVELSPEFPDVYEIVTDTTTAITGDGFNVPSKTLVPFNSIGELELICGGLAFYKETNGEERQVLSLVDGRLGDPIGQGMQVDEHRFVHAIKDIYEAKTMPAYMSGNLAQHFEELAKEYGFAEPMQPMAKPVKAKPTNPTKPAKSR